MKDFSEKGRLADYRIVHFATHGALAGELKGLSEPGLILTPPPSGTSDVKALEHDDGYLTASEVATLKLDADWVILSACNTAGRPARVPRHCLASLGPSSMPARAPCSSRTGLWTPTPPSS